TDATDSRNAWRTLCTSRKSFDASFAPRANIALGCGSNVGVEWNLSLYASTKGLPTDTHERYSASVRCVLEGGKVARGEVLKQGGSEVDRDGVYFGVFREGGGEVVVEDLRYGVRDGEVFHWIEERFAESWFHASFGRESAPLTPSSPPDVDAHDVASLRAYILSIPPQTLHSYTVSRLHADLDPVTLHHLAAFFASLAPPPALHCVRCHKTSRTLTEAALLCTTTRAQSCCGKTVEGNGNMGLSDGWCYEGQHTVHLCLETAIVLTAMQTDTKRARFRADPTMHDDKLVSCERLRCGMPPRSTRKRGRRSDGDEDEDEQSSVTSSHLSTNASPRSSNGRKKARTRAPPPLDESDQMDIDNSNSVPSPSPGRPPSSPNPRPRVKPKSKAKLKPLSYHSTPLRAYSPPP
ncbi:hypothetical protein C0992_011051, partial [Termitomyces sp. T32_za158]